MRGKSWSYSFKADNERNEAREEGGEPCSRGEWCASAARVVEDGVTRRLPAKGYQAFCAADQEIMGACITGFPATYGRLENAIGDHVAGEVMVRMPFGPSLEIRTDIDEIQRALVDSLMSWYERVARVDPTLSLPDTQDWRARSLGPYAAGLLPFPSKLLAERTSVLMALGPEPMVRPALIASLGCGAPEMEIGDQVLISASGADAGNEAMRLDYISRAALLETNPDTDRLLGVECEACGHRSLRRAAPPQHDGDPFYYAVCDRDACRHLVTDEEYKQWSCYLVRFYARRVTPAVLAAAGLRGDETPAVAAASAA